MRTEITPAVRDFDGRIVYRWDVIDERERVRDSGFELSAAGARRAAQRSSAQQGPCLLLDMLERRPRPTP